MTDCLRATYELTPEAGEDVEDKAVDITLEQTVELPEAVLSGDLRERVVGRIIDLEALDGVRWRAVIDFPMAAVGTELTQIVNVLFGNISLKRGIRLTAVHWPPQLRRALGGPGHGVAGLRRLTGVDDRALLAAAVKPVGLDPAALAAICRDFARGGIDIIKDDHGLADQASAPFTDRLEACQAAVRAANEAEGRRALYLPNVSAPWPRMMERARQARDAGCVAVLVNALPVGLDAPGWLRDELGLAVMAHPSLTGGLFRPGHGIAPEVLLGDLFRLAGADMVIYPNVGGRFGFDQALCDRINQRLREPIEDIRPALPTPGGGIDAARAGHWAERYGPDTLLLVGGSLYLQGDLAAAAHQLRRAVESQVPA
jgi:ribulose-bisphosphate carboxylase large chain